jgi:hypothetical protein
MGTRGFGSDFHCAQHPHWIFIQRARKKTGLPCAMQRVQLRAGLARLAGIAGRGDTARAMANWRAELARPCRPGAMRENNLMTTEACI